MDEMVRWKHSCVSAWNDRIAYSVHNTFPRVRDNVAVHLRRVVVSVPGSILRKGARARRCLLKMPRSDLSHGTRHVVGGVVRTEDVSRAFEHETTTNACARTSTRLAAL